MKHYTSTMFPQPPAADLSGEDSDLIRFAALNNEHIDSLLQSHSRNFPTANVPPRAAIKWAAELLPDLNFIVFDRNGCTVGHQVCMPLRKTVYEQLITGYFCEKDMMTLHLVDTTRREPEILYLTCSYAASEVLQRSIIQRIVSNVSHQTESKRIKVAVFAFNRATQNITRKLGMQLVYANHQEISATGGECMPGIYEIRLKNTIHMTRRFNPK